MIGRSLLVVLVAAIAGCGSCRSDDDAGAATMAIDPARDAGHRPLRRLERELAHLQPIDAGADAE